MSDVGLALLQRMAVRILGRYMTEQGCSSVVQTEGRDGYGRFVDLACLDPGCGKRVKVKSDPYFGTVSELIADRALPFYRQPSETFAFESVSNAATRSEGWALGSDASVLWYYRIAVTSREDEVRALLREPDEVFFSELGVEGDELTEVPMRELRNWFLANLESYTPRPVAHGAGSSWCRLVPESDLRAGLPAMRNVGSVFGGLKA